jgi:hypothetical protein
VTTSTVKKHHYPVGTATWTVEEQTKSDYKTALEASYNSKEAAMLKNAPKAKGYETQRLEMRTFAVDKLRATAKERYGTVAELFQAVRVY